MNANSSRTESERLARSECVTVEGESVCDEVLKECSVDGL